LFSAGFLSAFIKIVIDVELNNNKAMKRHESGRIVYYTSGLFDNAGIVHGFFTRLGGVSPAPFDSLNMKPDPADSTENITQNRKLATAALKQDPGRLVFASLDHNNRAEIVGEPEAGRDIDNTDGLITDSKNLPLMISVADCVPVILSRPDNMVAIVHASWRSLAAGIIPATIEKIHGLGIEPSELLAAIGPAVAVGNYEIKQDVIAIIKQKLKFHEQVLINKDSKTFFDLRKASELQLRQLGVVQIDHVAIDTFSRSDEFYSYRKEGVTGRFGMIAAL
jgi:hypothetical protein